MKNGYFILALMILIPLYNYGQWSNTTDNYTNGRLSLRQTSSSLGDIISLYGNRLDNTSMYGFGVEGSTIYYKTYANHRWYVGANADDGTSSIMELNNSRLYINGNMGIGTGSPGQSLEVITPYSNNVDEEIRIGTNIPNIGFTGLGFNFYSTETGAFSRQITEYVGGKKYIPINFSYGNTLFNGIVGIGTTVTGTHKLAVDGTIGAREIKVEAGSWSDFVFSKEYELRNLEEVESFIEENNHLPDIPSEKEVIENGIQLGEMDAKLLQKIEELTLYMIDINKRVESLEEENKALKKENSILKTQ